jgi:hypothetical protein
VAFRATQIDCGEIARAPREVTRQAKSVIRDGVTIGAKPPRISHAGGKSTYRRPDVALPSRSDENVERASDRKDGQAPEPEILRRVQEVVPSIEERHAFPTSDRRRKVVDRSRAAHEDSVSGVVEPD